MNKIISIIKTTGFLSAITILAACNKDKVENPIVTEEELITTMVLSVSDNTGWSQEFRYKVESGIGSGSSNATIDTIKLAPNKNYAVAINVLNEQPNPVDDITDEIITESEEHLFIYESNPASGAGSITTSGGDLDAAGEPLNRTILFNTGAAGNGSLTVTLKHEPTNKSATTADAAGGETDAQAIFPVVLQ